MLQILKKIDDTIHGCKIFRSLLFYLIALAGNLIFISTGFALNQKPSSPLSIEAAQSQYDYKTGKAVFLGNVIIKQDGMTLTADKVITQNNSQHQIQHLFAFGEKNLAHYTQLSQNKNSTLEASARIIRYFPINKLIILEKTANVAQDKNHFSGDIIHYNQAEQSITIPPKSKGSASLIYHPKQRA